jgi:hypothetical protein
MKDESTIKNKDLILIDINDQSTPLKCRKTHRFK